MSTLAGWNNLDEFFFYMRQRHSLNSSMRRFHEQQELIRSIHGKRHTSSLNTHTHTHNTRQWDGWIQRHKQASQPAEHIWQEIIMGIIAHLLSRHFNFTFVNFFPCSWKHLLVFRPLLSCVCPAFGHNTRLNLTWETGAFSTRLPCCLSGICKHQPLH